MCNLNCVCTYDIVYNLATTLHITGTVCSSSPFPFSYLFFFPIRLYCSCHFNVRFVKSHDNYIKLVNSFMHHCEHLQGNALILVFTWTTKMRNKIKQTLAIAGNYHMTSL